MELRANAGGGGEGERRAAERVVGTCVLNLDDHPHDPVRLHPASLC